MTHWLGRFTALLATVFLAAGAAAVGLPAAAASPSAGSNGATGLRVAAEPFGDYVDRLRFDVDAVTPALVTSGGPRMLTITGRLTNTGPEAITDPIYRFHRGDALPDAAAVRQELAEPGEPSAVVQQRFTPVATRGTTLAAGGSVPFRFTAAITGADGLAVTAPGVYPLMVNINGGVVLPEGSLAARVGELHLLLTVIGVPGTAPSAGTTDGAPSRSRPLPVNVVWPIVDQPHLGVGGVFLNEDLLAAIAPGGRLRTLVDALGDPAAASLPPGSVTVVLDPQLLDELDRMTQPYRVVTDPAAPQPSMNQIVQAAQSAAAAAATTGTATTSSAARPTPKRTVTAPPLRSSTPGAAAATTAPAAATGAPPPAAAVTPTGGAAASSAPAPTSGATTPTSSPATSNPATSNSATTGTTAGTSPGDTGVIGSADIPGTRAGTGQAAAASFVERLRAVAGRYPVVTLPYGDPDVVALVRNGLTGEVDAAVQHGTSVARRVLGTAAANLSTTTGYPINGAIDASTLSALRKAGLTTGLLAGSSVAPGSPPGAAAVVSDGSAPDTAAANRLPSVIAEADVLDGVRNLIARGQQSGWATRVNALTGIVAQRSMDGSAGPAVFTPARRWAPDAAGLRVLTDLLTNLGDSGVIAGVPLGRIAGGATAGAVTAYPDEARLQELPDGYLQRISSGRREVASLRRTLASTPQASDPELVLAPLDRALDDTASTAFRQNPAVGDANLGTVESTTATIRQGVQILSAGNSYTLASSTSPLLLTVQNTLPWDVPVRVRIRGGELVGLTVTDPQIQVVPAGRSQQIRIPAEVSRSGQFQVTAELVAADGTSWGPPVELSVESTAYGALTVIIIVVAGGVLVLMVVLRITQRLRARRARLAAGAPVDADTNAAVGRDEHESHVGTRDVLLADPAEKARADATTVKTTDQVGTESS